ncbi:hypothetical protein BJ912DRAFT_1140642 [Pholiota molesta]|nr:hypothetical protein BJ912DRAFT_1140642 [Pholiota molesta]
MLIPSRIIEQDTGLSGRLNRAIFMKATERSLIKGAFTLGGSRSSAARASNPTVTPGGNSTSWREARAAEGPCHRTSPNSEQGMIFLSPPHRPPRIWQRGRGGGVHAVQAQAQEELRAPKGRPLPPPPARRRCRNSNSDAPQPPVLSMPSLKRKRDDSNEDADADDAARGSSENGPPVLVVPTSTSAAEPSEEEELAELFALERALAMHASARDRSMCDRSVCGSSSYAPPPPPRKRARRVAGLMARTATAVGVGAVVAWTALAFS